MELGYTFYPSSTSGALGHPRLDVNLYPAPTGKHFDPREMTLPAYNADRGINRLILSHPAETQEVQISAGRIILINFSRSEAEIFSFGGGLKVENLETHSRCQLDSPAPIFDLGQFSGAQCDLVSEYESQLAISKANWHNEEVEFEARLAEIDPLNLFVALTTAIQQRLHMLPVKVRNESYWDLQHAIRSAVRFINPDGLLPTDHPTLQELFALPG